MDTPCQTQTTEDANGRDARGRFVKGNAGGPGNPFARQVGQLRKVLLEALTTVDMEQIARKLIERVKEGDFQAVKMLFTYTLGRPSDAVEPDRLDLDEGRFFQESAQMQPGLLKAALVPEPALALEMARNLRPAMARDLARKIGEELRGDEPGATAATEPSPSPNGDNGEVAAPTVDMEMELRRQAERAREIELSLRADELLRSVPPALPPEPELPPSRLPPPSPNGRRRKTSRPAPSPNGESVAGPGTATASAEEIVAELLAQVMQLMRRQ